MQLQATRARENILRAFRDIAARAGGQAWIIVAGYPQPVNPEGAGSIGFPAESARIMNAATELFNDVLRGIVEECRQSGMKICFVPVSDAFEGHGAYTEDPYISPVTFGALDQDLKSFQVASSYSVHPNEKGAEAYARCVQEAIDALEAGRDVP